MSLSGVVVVGGGTVVVGSGVVFGTSQRVPWNWSVHLHVAITPLSSQVPPFRQRPLQARIK